MNRLIRIILPCYFSIFILDGCNKVKVSNNNDDKKHYSIKSKGISTENKAIIADTAYSEQEYDANEERPEHRGNLIVEHNNIKVYADYGLSEEDSKYGDDITAKDETYLIRYINDVPRDSMIIKGPYNSLLGNNNVCQITVGTDTVCVDTSKPFCKVSDIRFTGVLKGCQFYRYSKHYTLNERSASTDFQINIAIREDTPEYIMNFINKRIRDDVAGYFCNHAGDRTICPDIPLFNIKEGNLTRMSQHYYKQFCRLYKKEYSYESDMDELPSGPPYSYQIYAYPVWENSDSTLITWKFYGYFYMGGAHGRETEYFLTFDNNTGRVLGADDFYTNYNFNKAIGILRHQLNAYHDRDASGTYNFSAALDNDSNAAAVKSTILNEVVDGKTYPRPALIRQGIVFTYQTYEKGSNADGILHFAQPYNQDNKLK